MRRNNDIRKDDTVVVIRDIHRYDTEGVYARKGDTGKVIEVFTPTGSKANTTKYAKVVMGDGSGCKTFKLTSLEREN